MTCGAVERLGRMFLYEIPEFLRIGDKSKFLDIGSGFGKVVMHMRILIPNLEKCFGVECLPLRVSKSKEITSKLENEGILVRNSVQFDCCDATKIDSFDATHIFCFDYVFSDETHRGLIPVLVRSRPKVLVLFISPKKLKKFGCDGEIVCIQRFMATTTGGQHPVGFVYSHKDWLK
jgi:SAM-dependent methyltransferase